MVLEQWKVSSVMSALLLISFNYNIGKNEESLDKLKILYSSFYV